MKKTEESVVEDAIEALEYWYDEGATSLPNAIGCVIVRYAELLHKGIVSERITKLDTKEHIEELEKMIKKKYCSCCGHKLEKQI